jgi:hypothetical protein
MYTVWTNPSSVKRGKGSGVERSTRTTKKAVIGVLTPVIVNPILAASPVPIPLGSTISLTATAGQLMHQVKDMEEAMSPTSRRAGVTRKFSGTTYYEHARHSNKGAAEKQGRALRKAGYKVRITS